MVRVENPRASAERAQALQQNPSDNRTSKVALAMILSFGYFYYLNPYVSIPLSLFTWYILLKDSTPHPDRRKSPPPSEPLPLPLASGRRRLTRTKSVSWQGGHSGNQYPPQALGHLGNKGLSPLTSHQQRFQEFDAAARAAVHGGGASRGDRAALEGPHAGNAHASAPSFPLGRASQPTRSSASSSRAPLGGDHVGRPPASAPPPSGRRAPLGGNHAN